MKLFYSFDIDRRYVYVMIFNSKKSPLILKGL